MLRFRELKSTSIPFDASSQVLEMILNDMISFTTIKVSKMAEIAPESGIQYMVTILGESGNMDSFTFRTSTVI